MATPPLSEKHAITPVRMERTEHPAAQGLQKAGVSRIVTLLDVMATATSRLWG
jgi:hypothetical protein